MHTIEKKPTRAKGVREILDFLKGVCPCGAHVITHGLGGDAAGGAVVLNGTSPSKFCLKKFKSLTKSYNFA